MKDTVQTIIGELLDHTITLEQAVTAIDDVYRPKTVSSPRQKGRNNLHWVDCSKNGKIDVYHVTDCQGGESCRLTQYLNDEKNPIDKHIKRGRQYEAWYEKSQWTFDDVGESEDIRAAKKAKS